MSWWKRLLGGAQTPTAKTPIDSAAPSGETPEQTDEQFYISTRTETDTRAEHALPGTADFPRILELAPPPRTIVPDLRPDRDFAPDPVATFVIEWPSAHTFRRDAFRAALQQEAMERFGQPTPYARLPNGRVTFLSSGNDGEFDPEATALIAAWDLREGEGPPDLIAARAAAMSAWMAARPERFSTVQPDTAKLQQQWDRAQAIIAVRPEYVAILAKPRQAMFDGRMVWRTLHGMGIAWGDMDQFQWEDPTHQTDYLFWAEVDDGEIGFALPERIAEGTQHFHRVRFIFDVARSPAPQHVLGQMQRAAEAFAAAMDCDLMYIIDQSEVPGVVDLQAAVASSVRDLKALDVVPGSSAVCQLR